MSLLLLNMKESFVNSRVIPLPTTTNYDNGKSTSSLFTIMDKNKDICHYRDNQQLFHLYHYHMTML